MPKTLLKNVLLPAEDGKSLVLTDILIHGQYIERIGRVEEQDCEQVVDGEGRIAIPGLVNAHWHTMSSLIKARYSGYPLEIWRQYVRGVWGTLAGRSMYIDSMLGLIEMLENGVTCVIDHIAHFGDDVESTLGMARQACVDVGIRAFTSVMISDVSYEKTIPLNTGLLDESAKNAISWINAKETGATLESVDNFLKAFHKTNDRVRCSLGPAAPQRCSREVLLKLKDMSEQLDIPMHMHVLETKTQALHCRNIFGKSAIAYLDELGLLDKRLSMAHVVWVDDDDIERIARSGATVVHNPASNLKLGSGIAPIPKMLAHGVNVALGTDGSCSNDSQNMFEAMKMIGLIHNINEPDYKNWLSGKTVFGCATENGARGLGLHGVTGRIEAGKKADFVLLKKDSLSLTPLNNFYEQLVFCESGKAVDSVFIDGREVVKHGAVITVDKSAILREALEIHAEIAGNAPQIEAKVMAAEASLRRMYGNVMDLKAPPENS